MLSQPLYVLKVILCAILCLCLFLYIGVPVCVSECRYVSVWLCVFLTLSLFPAVGLWVYRIMAVIVFFISFP